MCLDWPLPQRWSPSTIAAKWYDAESSCRWIIESVGMSCVTDDECILHARRCPRLTVCADMVAQIHFRLEVIPCPS